MVEISGARIAPNWTSAAGALEGILAHLGAPLPRHAIMGLTGHAWRLCLGRRDNVVALPSGPADLDWAAAQGKAGETIRLGYQEDETFAASTWNIPAAHYLESWGDAVTTDGVYVPIQPLIELTGVSLCERGTCAARHASVGAPARPRQSA